MEADSFMIVLDTASQTEESLYVVPTGLQPVKRRRGNKRARDDYAMPQKRRKIPSEEDLESEIDKEVVDDPDEDDGEDSVDNDLLRLEQNTIYNKYYIYSIKPGVLKVVKTDDTCEYVDYYAMHGPSLNAIWKAAVDSNTSIKGMTLANILQIGRDTAAKCTPPLRFGPDDAVRHKLFLCMTTSTLTCPSAMPTF